MIAVAACLSAVAASAQQPGTVDVPVAHYVNPPVPLLSVGSLAAFLEGTWTAQSRDGKQELGTYTWATELNGHVLARHGSAPPNCLPANAACGRNDLLYVFQDSAGAPLRAIYFDNEGHVVRYEISLRYDELPAGHAHREFAVFLSDAAALGPRYRLTYERNTDTQTGATVLNGRFEILMANNEWRTEMEWFGKKT